MKIQYPDTLDYGSNATVDATVNAALRSSPDLFTRLKGVNPKILSLKMESLSGLRKLDMLGDGLGQKLTIIDTAKFVGYHINREELMSLDWPLSDPTYPTPEGGYRKIIHAAFHSGLMIAIIGIEGEPLSTSLALYFIKPEESLSFQENPRSPPPVLPKGVRPCDITAIAIDQNYIIMACEMKILVWSRVEDTIDLASPKEYDLRQAEKDTDPIIDIIIRDGCIIALTKDGQVCCNQGPRYPGAWRRSPELGQGAKSISMSLGKEKVIFVDYPTIVKTVYYAPSKPELLLGRTLDYKRSFHKNDSCEAIAIAVTSNSEGAITPDIDFYSTLNDESIGVGSLGRGFPEYLGQYMAFIFDSYSITYFGSEGIVQLDYRTPAERKLMLAAAHSSRYITLNFSVEVEQVGEDYEISGKCLKTGHKRKGGPYEYDDNTAKKPKI